MDVAGLADTMATILSLGVHRRIPVAVVEDYGVGSGEIYSDSARPRRKDEDEDAGIGVK